MRESSRHQRLLRVAAIGLVAAAAATRDCAAVAPLGPELQVNSFTPSAQGRPDVAMDRDGNFVVVWNSDGQDGHYYGVFARRFDGAGGATSGEIQVNQFTGYEQASPALAMDGDGDFVVVWQSYGQDGDEYGVFARRFSSAGVAAGGEIQVNTYTTSYQRAPVVAMNDDGAYVVVWGSDRDGSGAGVFAQLYDSSGTALGGELQVNAHTLNYQGNPEVAMDAEGDFVVAWESYQDGSSYGIFARLFTSSGAAATGEIMVNTHTVNLQAGPTVAMNADGEFVVAWESYSQDGSSYGIFARRFSSTGDPASGEIAVNTHTIDAQIDPFVAIDPSGDFVVTWRSPQDGSDYAVIARRFRGTGVAASGEIVVNAHTAGYQGDPAVAMNRAGDFIVAWTSDGQDGSDYGVFARRFVARVLDVDGDGEADGWTDGLLILRGLFNFTGEALTTGAVDLADCTRCTPAAIAGHLQTIGPWLDVDDDGELQALTDGILILRYLVGGFEGAALTAGAVDESGCERCETLDIESYLATLR